ncbi:hypothetical protein DB32_002793 [Sandaracinus amylolyticus]|uniref:Uncharacterized protein n=1 Tax=Sandaracinus amylolyticus TaxID=927083 RepID=A0A0F6SER3_9BACT|nr:hypothetical protein DB32_002793 [Sandaracinus amylolyticus]
MRWSRGCPHERSERQSLRERATESRNDGQAGSGSMGSSRRLRPSTRRDPVSTLDAIPRKRIGTRENPPIRPDPITGAVARAGSRPWDPTGRAPRWERITEP